MGKEAATNWFTNRVHGGRDERNKQANQVVTAKTIDRLVWRLDRFMNEGGRRWRACSHRQPHVYNLEQK